MGASKISIEQDDERMVIDIIELNSTFRLDHILTRIVCEMEGTFLEVGIRQGYKMDMKLGEKRTKRLVAGELSNLPLWRSLKILPVVGANTIMGNKFKD